MVAIAFHPNLGISLANFPSFFLHDSSEFGCPVLSTFETTAQCLNDEHRVSLELPKLGSGNEAEEGRAAQLQVGLGNVALVQAQAVEFGDEANEAECGS